jgi:hypothetical protein
LPVGQSAFIILVVPRVPGVPGIVAIVLVIAALPVIPSYIVREEFRLILILRAVRQAVTVSGPFRGLPTA